jgi:polygalacturonase
MRILFSVICFLLPVVIFSKTIDLKTFGAKGDGKTIETKIVQKAIDAVFTEGGGTVIFSSGKTFVTGTIYLKSNVEIHIERGATWLGSPSMSDYDKTKPHLLAAYGAKNIALTAAQWTATDANFGKTTTNHSTDPCIG